MGKNTRLIKVFPLKIRSDAINALEKYFTDIGCPELLFYDQAGEETSGEWDNICNEIKLPTHLSEANHQHQNGAEMAVRNLKHISNKMLNNSDNAFDRYWCYTLELAAEIMNSTANR